MSGRWHSAAWFVGLLLVAPLQVNADEPLLLAGAAPVNLKLEITVDGQSPQVAWQAFLDQLFDYFDQDASGALSQTEAARIFPLPLPSKEPLSIRWVDLDADRDGKVSPADFRSYCQVRGFTPLAGIAAPPSAVDQHLGKIFSAAWNHTRESDQKGGEQKFAPNQLLKYDLNDNEYLDRQELLDGQPQHSPAEISAKVADATTGRSLNLRIDLGAKPAIEIRGDAMGAKLEFHAASQRFLLVDAQQSCVITGSLRASLPAVKSAGEFLLAQLTDALGERQSLSKQEVEGDPNLGGLRELFPYADRNQDAQLTPAELTAYQELIVAAVQAQLFITLRNQGHNLFSLFDQDHDGRLSPAELAPTRGRPADMTGAIPTVLSLEFGASPAQVWGGMRIPAAKLPPIANPSAAAAPAGWFGALDRNRDGVVSPREFLGPPAAFRRLDTSGNGLIEATEVLHPAH